MTLEELNRYFDLVNSLQKTQELLAKFRNATLPGAQVLTGMPHSSGIADLIGDLAVEIADLTAREEYILSEIAIHKEAVDAYVANIEDSYLMIMFRLRFQRGLTFKAIASILGGGNSEDSVKSAVYRYINKNENSLPDDAS